MLKWSYCKGGLPTKIKEKNTIKWSAWPRLVEGDWAKLLLTLNWFNQVPHTYADGEPIEPLHDGKTCVPSISGAVYAEGEKRGKEHIQGIHLLILDVDNKGPVDTHLTWEQAKAHFSQFFIKVAMYTTYSSTGERNKFRVVLPLSRPVRPDLWKEMLEWSVDYLGLQDYREAMDLGCMRKPAQVYFLRGSWDNLGGQIISRSDGEEIPVPEDAELEVMPVPDLPGETGQRHLEPFELDFIKRVNVDLNTLDLAAVLRHKGIEVSDDQQLVGGTKNRCHCPWAGEHTGQRDDDGAYLVQMDGKWPVFRCSHSNHLMHGLPEVLEWAGPAVLALYGEPYHRSPAMQLKLNGSVGSLCFGSAQ